MMMKRNDYLDRLGDDEKAALEKIQGLASKATAKMKEILMDPKASVYAQLQAIDMVLERTYGKPELMVKVQSPQEDVEAARARIQAIINRVRIEMENEEEGGD